jgi:acid stress chaperone HdeB
MPCRRVMRAFVFRHLEVVHTSDMLNDAVAGVVPDMRTATCNDFIGFKRDTTFAIMWLDAYYFDEDDPPIIDFEKIRQKAARLTVYCNQNPTHSLTTESEPIIRRK